MAAAPSRAVSSESSYGAPADSFSNLASLSSTPPTTVADSMSLASDTPKTEHVAAADNARLDADSNGPDGESRIDLAESMAISTNDAAAAAAAAATPQSTHFTPVNTNQSAAHPPASERSRRRRVTAPIYNLAKLAGTAVHGKRRAKGDIVSNRKRKPRHPVVAPQPAEEQIATAEGAEQTGKVEESQSVDEPQKAGNSGKLENESAQPAETTEIPENRKPAESAATVENVAKLEKRPSKTFVGRRSSTREPKSPKSPKSKTVKKAKRDPSPRRYSTRASGVEVESLANKLSTLGKRGRKTFEKGITKMTREMRRLQDTNEYTGIDTRPVVYTTWANGKYVDPNAESEDEDEEEEEEEEEVQEEEEPPRKKAKHSESSKVVDFEVPDDEQPVVQKRRVKKWLDRGLYAGQEAPLDIYKGLTPNEKKSLAQLPELLPSAKVNKTMPQPMFSGLRTLIQGRDFKLPFDVCNPLPPGQPKPDEWRKMTKNRFVGDAAAYWKKTPHFKDYQSKCVCTPEDGCTESCQNRIMLYECDATNCNVGEKHCANRAFARLQERVKAGGKFRVGVEVLKTEDRGYGIRANRPFRAGQIIMEYTGEIITEEECDRRMNEKYKDNKCYYLMSFDQNMIIDATTGSIARFVNHSCTPNSRMVKWIVSGQPRMALFAGDQDIMTGEELTYDYNFDPFSAKNVQKCLCGSPNCRGVLGPKPKEVKPPKPSKAELAKALLKGMKAGKRKMKEALGDDDNDGGAAKKRKIKTPAGVKAKSIKSVKRALSTASVKAAAKGAAKKVVKRSVSTIAVNAKAARGQKATGRKIATVRKSKSVVKTYSKAKVAKQPNAAEASPKKTASRKSSLTTIVAAAPDDEQTPSPGASKKRNAPAPSNADTPEPSPRNSLSPRKALDVQRPVNKIRLVKSPSA
ncbi:hypothetical protein F4780DRAFT_778704 [Xylariomycetidae sp. FL0641]|nr:hypothetical protein F4780DRAFT_778704 [Xylariomycetidae sp. FL0641]